MEKPLIHISTAHRKDDTRIVRLMSEPLLEQGREVQFMVPVSGEKTSPFYIPLPEYKQRWKRMILGPFWVLLALLKTKTLARLIFHDPELLLVAVIAKWMGYTVYFDAHESYRLLMLQKRYLPDRWKMFFSKVYQLLETTLCAQLDGVIAATPFIAKEYVGFRTFIFENIPDFAQLQKIKKANSIHEKAQHWFYAGIISEERGITEALDLLLDQQKHQKTQLHLIGSFYPNSYEAEVKAHPAWKFVRYEAWLPYDTMISKMKAADIGLLLFRPLPNHLWSQPNKLFEYQACGLPIIATRMPGWEYLLQNWKVYWWSQGENLPKISTEKINASFKVKSLQERTNELWAWIGC